MNNLPDEILSIILSMTENKINFSHISKSYRRTFLLSISSTRHHIFFPATKLLAYSEIVLHYVSINPFTISSLIINFHIDSKYLFKIFNLLNPSKVISIDLKIPLELINLQLIQILNRFHICRKFSLTFSDTFKCINGISSKFLNQLKLINLDILELEYFGTFSFTSNDLLYLFQRGVREIVVHDKKHLFSFNEPGFNICRLDFSLVIKLKINLNCIERC